MEDVRNTYRINEKSELGDVHISDDVLAVISAMAALEVDGVVGMAGNITSEIVAKLGMKKLSKGVRVDVAEGSVMVDVSIISFFKSPSIVFGQPITCTPQFLAA